MARPIKTGLDYFPLDVTIDDSIELIEAEHGLTGFAIIVKLWQKIYSNGYFIDWNNDNSLLFSKRINTDLTIINSIINSCFLRGIFDEKLFKKYKILTSSGIQKRFILASSQSKRKSIILIREYTLVNSELIELITEFTQLNTELSTQSKVKESKVKESKVNKIFNPPSEKDVIDYFIEKGYKESIAITAYNHYNEAKWHDVKGNKVLNWKQKMISVWFKEENKLNYIKPNNSNISQKSQLQELININELADKRIDEIYGTKNS